MEWSVCTENGIHTTISLCKKNNTKMIIGRDPNNCDIILPHSSISRQHASLSNMQKNNMNMENILLSDTHSSQGTFCNGTEINTDGILLSEGDVITFGTDPTTYTTILSTKKRKYENENEKSTNIQEPNMEESEDDDNDNEMSQIMERYKLPISHQIQLLGHEKSITALAVDPAGVRMATASMDYTVKLWDFTGMARSIKAFREMEIEEGHPVVAVSYSPTGSHLLTATASSQPKVVTREGVEVLHCVKGDMYIRDMVLTFGHTHAVTGGQWHPTEKEKWMTSSLDGTLRQWTMSGKTAFGKLKNERIWKARSVKGLRIGITACTYSAPGSSLLMWAATSDGQLQAFDPRKQAVSVRPERVVVAHDVSTGVEGVGITSVATSPNGFYLASRGADSCVKVWDIRKMGAPSPVKTFTGMHTLLPTANVAFSPNSTSLAVGTNVERQADGEDLPGRLHLLDVSSSSTTPLHTLVLDSSVGCVNWSPSLNQIIVGLQNGSTKVLFNPNMSKKGALISATRKLRPLPSIETFARIDGGGDVGNPNALPMYRTEAVTAAQTRNANRRDPKKSRKPDMPSADAAIKGGDGLFTKFFMKDRVKEKSAREDDPREAILKYATQAEKNPQFVSVAYVEEDKVDPRYRLTSKTLEQEKVDKQKAQDRSLL